jgi:predicted small metal-binding protein
MTAPRYRLICACGWQVEGPSDEVVRQTQEHGRRLHNMETTEEQVLQMAVLLPEGAS